MYKQISMFDELVQDPEKKPIIGTDVIFFLGGEIYDAVVTKHIGHDFFYIVFLDKKPSDDNPDIYPAEGWHISMRGYKEDWDYR